MLLRAQFLFFTTLPIFLGAPTSKNEDAEANIVKFENTNDGNGNYHFSYETSNGISRDETGTLVNDGKSGAHIVVKGTVSYINPDGDLISVRYSADENGYHILPVDDFNIFESEVPVLEVAVSPLVVASLLGGG